MFYILDSSNGLIGTCEGFSYSIQREKMPVYVMGCANPLSFSRGKTGTAVSLRGAWVADDFMPECEDLIVVGTSGPDRTPLVFFFNGTAFGVQSSNSPVNPALEDITMGADALVFGDAQDFNCAMTLVNHYIRIELREADQCIAEMEASFADQ